MGKLPLEGFKFAVYIGAPVLAVTYFQRPDVFRRIIENRNYIQYPPEDERSPEELLEAISKKKSAVGAASKVTRNAASVEMDMERSAFGSDNSVESKNFHASNAPAVPWRRYFFFGPRDDLEALEKKNRMKATRHH